MKRWNMYTANEIKPKGWLYRQLLIQADGLSGNLDKIWPDVRDSAWIGGSREGWERVPYWLDGFIPLAYLLEDEDMIARAKQYIDAIISRQAEDGWICPCSREERRSYDTWAVQLISKVLVVYYECSQDSRIPPILYRTLRNYYDLLKAGEIKLFDWGEYRWFEIMIAVNFTYERYPEDWLTELARLMREQGADYEKFTDTWKAPLNQWTFHTHIVNLAMMLKSEAVSCDRLGEAYTDRAERLHAILKQYNATAVETFTGDECLSGLSPIQGTELCAVVEQMYSYELLFAYTGDSKWAERLEVLAFNALPATVSEDMWTHQYLQMNNQIACRKFPGKPIFRTNGPEGNLFGLEPNFGCCTANFNQGWPKFALSAFMHSGSTVISAVPAPCALTCDCGRIELETDYPFDNCLQYTVEARRAFQLQIRIPAGAEHVTVDGAAFAGDTAAVDVAAGETRKITVRFDFTPRFESYPAGLSYVQCGSLVFALPIRHRDVMLEFERDGVPRKFPYCDYELIPESDWNYGFADTALSVARRPVSPVPFSEAHPPVTVTAHMQRIDWGPEDGYEFVCARLPRSRTPLAPPQEIALQPYGCTKLRMTLMPFTE